jgi:D-alanyl-D-alanine carboxypeptidase
MENLINEEIIRVKELMGILNEDITVNIPQVIKSKLKDVERKYNVTITDANVNAELKEEGQYYDDNGGEDAKARKQIDKLVSALRQTFPNIKKGVVSSYRSYDQQVDTFGGKIARDGGVSKRQRYSALPGFSQHHTGKTFDILSVEPSWWNQNSDVKKWVADNCGKFGFKVSYPSDGVLRKAEPWHLYYVGGESSESSTITPTIPNSKVDDYYSSDKVDPKLEKETVKQFKKVGCTASRDYSESPTFDEILKDNSKVIRIGHKGNPVNELQKILDGLGYDLGKCGIDGLFGPKTKKALEQFQSDRGLTVSSSVNKETLDKLKKPGDKVTVSTPSKDTQVSADVTNDNEYSIIKSDYKGKNVHVLFGGSHTSTYSKNGADPSSIQKYVKFLKPYSNNAIIVITHHMNTLDNVRKYVKEKLDGAVVTSIAGFSQGGKETWRHADDSSLKLVGLIDPSTYSIDLTLGSNTYLVCDPNNWGPNDFVGQVRKKLQWYCQHKDDPKYVGHVECTKGKRHMNFDILEYFYEKYGSRI